MPIISTLMITFWLELEQPVQLIKNIFVGAFKIHKALGNNLQLASDSKRRWNCKKEGSSYSELGRSLSIFSLPDSSTIFGFQLSFRWQMPLLERPAKGHFPVTGKEYNLSFNWRFELGISQSVVGYATTWATTSIPKVGAGIIKILTKDFRLLRLGPFTLL